MINDGGPAYPNVYYSEPIGSIGPQLTIKGGMTLRDYFASAALQGLLASPAEAEFGVSHFATAAYEAADAMLKAREAKL